jgi:antitoxin (DNA-binding transcriptional repressor) of toxin-antitoxin stability system
MREMDVADILADFDAVLDQVERGETIAILRNGRRVAYLAPATEQNIAPAST